MRSLFFSVCALSAVLSNAQVVELSVEHVDINLSYSAPSTFGLSLNDDDNGFTYGPSGAVLTVLPDARRTYTGTETGSFAFVGVPIGGTYWRLPQGQNPNLLYLGMAAYGVTPASIDTFDPSSESAGRATGIGAWSRLILHHVAADGFFSAWQSTATGPRVMISTSNGITTNDSLWLLAGSHLHFNFGFTTTGTYDVQFKIQVRQPDGNNATAGTPILSRAFPVHFGVETRAAPITGQATLQDFAGTLESQSIKVEISLNGVVFDRKTQPLMDPDPNQAGNVGEFAVSTGLRGAGYDIVIKPSHFLSRKLSNVTLTNDGLSGLNLTFINGDVDGDDSITIFDYIDLSTSFDLSVGDAGFNPNADLDGDGSVTIFDYIILSNNFDQSGEGA